MTLQARKHHRTFYHGTSRERAKSILAQGVDIEASRKRDPGDFGWGFYLTCDLIRAQNCGEVVLVVEIDTSTFAYLPSPYFLDGLTHIEPTTEVEHLFHDTVFTLIDDEWWEMGTVNGTAEERQRTARKVRATFLSQGHGGIETPNADGEIVVFDPACIRHVHVVAQ